jgi:hypothetical protein
MTSPTITVPTVSCPSPQPTANPVDICDIVEWVLRVARTSPDYRDDPQFRAACDQLEDFAVNELGDA